MLTVIRDAQDRIQAVCDWWLVDDQGCWEPYGRYVWVEQLELVPGARGAAMIRRVIQDIAARAPWTVGAYWERRAKDAEPRLHGFRRQQLVKEVKV